jgi:serralysin
MCEKDIGPGLIDHRRGFDGLLGQETKEDIMSTVFRVILEGSQEVPPINSTASGVGTIVFDSEAVAASYSFDIQGLDFGPITSGQLPTDPNDVNNTHFHSQVRGVAGPVVFGQITPAHDNDDLAIVLNADGSWSESGRWETTDPAPIDGTFPPAVNIPGTFASVLGSAAVGSDVPIYFNVHTVQFPAGEIRGQLVAIADDIDNVVTGTTGNDVLSGLSGNDAIQGLAGDDILDGGEGNDVLDGGGGNDTLTGGKGNDILEGSVGNDVADGGNGNDTINGGDGNDVLSGGRGDDNFNTGQGDDVVFGGQGNDRIGGMAGRDVVMAGAGDDFIAWNDPTGDVVFGGRGNDTILGGDIAADEIHGGAGDDLIRAFTTSPESATASDRLFGDAGDDVVIGGNAADIIEGGHGDDILTGNDGADVFIFRANQTGNDTLTDFDPSEDVVQLVGFDTSFDPLAALSATAQGAELDLGQGDSVLFLGRTVAEFSANDFQIV